MKKLLISKTFWAGVAGILTATSGYFTGDLSIAESIQLGFTAIVGIFLRDGIRKENE